MGPATAKTETTSRDGIDEVAGGASIIESTYKPGSVLIGHASSGDERRTDLCSHENYVNITGTASGLHVMEGCLVSSRVASLIDQIRKRKESIESERKVALR